MNIDDLPMPQLEPGTLWQSKLGPGDFEVISGPESMSGTDGWEDEIFTGYRAKRIFDGKVALVALTQKPDEYTPDYVFV